MCRSDSLLRDGVWLTADVEAALYVYVYDQRRSNDALHPTAPTSGGRGG